MNEWISVEEGLPDSLQWVLCYQRDNYKFVKYIIESCMDFTNKDSTWFKSEFSHWQPLPEPPKP